MEEIIPQEVYQSHQTAIDLCIQFVNQIESLKKQILDLKEQSVNQIESLKKQNSDLKEQILYLQSQIDKNSHNSHKPPSTDGLKKKNVSAFPRVKSSKKVGGQENHIGETLKMVETPNYVEIHTPEKCECCGRSFQKEEAKITSERRQVFDIPKQIQIEVTEHKIGEITCCGKTQRGVFPSNVRSPVQYGERIKAFVTDSSVRCNVSNENIVHLLSGVFNHGISVGSVVNIKAEAYKKLYATEQEIKQRLLTRSVLHFDETGARIEGETRWAHVACNKDFTYLFFHRKRGKEALISAESILKNFHNIACHDFWSSYFHFTDVRHVLCNAHILRELLKQEEEGKTWAKDMRIFLINLLEAKQKKQPVPSEKDVYDLYQKLCNEGLEREPPPKISNRGKPKNTVGRNLLNRLLQEKAGILAFAFDENIPFTNNQAERDIRCIKIKMKVSMSFRSERCAHHYARIKGFISTLLKNSINPYQELCKVFGQPTYSLPIPE